MGTYAEEAADRLSPFVEDFMAGVKARNPAEYADELKEATYTRIDSRADHNPLWDVKADCAFPSATQNEINANDAANLLRNGCYLVAEGSNMPTTPVSRGDDALTLLREGQRFDLVITTLHVEDLTPLRLARSIREEGFDTPVVLLAYDTRELGELFTDDFDRVFVWRGDVRLLGAITR